MPKRCGKGRFDAQVYEQGRAHGSRRQARERPSSLRGEWIQTEHRVIDEAAEQPGILATRHYRVSIVVSLQSVASSSLLLRSAASWGKYLTRSSRKRDEDRYTHTCIIASLRSVRRLWLSFSLFFSFSFLPSFAGSTFAPRPTPPRYLEKDTHGRRSKPDEDGRADVRYRRYVSASFLLWLSSSLSLSRSDFATLRRVPAGRTARGEEREGGHAHVDYRISLPPRLRSSSLRSRSLRFYNARSLSCHLEKDIHIPNRIRGISNRGTVKSSPECTR